jgi:cytochrome c-type biogenesis protein CcmH
MKTTMLGTLLWAGILLSTMAQADATITGRVQLDPAIAAQAAPEDTLYVFARAESGPRMPLAVIKAKVRELPLDFRLDDGMAMSPAMRLSQFPKVVVVARVAKSGSTRAEHGDLEGMSLPVAPGARGVTVVINRVVP